MLIVTGRLPDFPASPVTPPSFGLPALAPVMPRELVLGGAHQPAVPTLMGLGAGTGLAVGGNTGVQRLQTSLAQLAVVVNRPAINPGPADGLVDATMMMAVVQAFNILAEKLPAEARYPLQVALLAGTFTSTAMNLVKSYADVLNAAAQAAIMKYTQAPSLPLPPTPGAAPGAGGQAVPAPSPSLPVTPWFKQPLGILAIVGGIVGSVGIVYAIVK